MSLSVGPAPLGGWCLILPCFGVCSVLEFALYCVGGAVTV